MTQISMLTVVPLSKKTGQNTSSKVFLRFANGPCSEVESRAGPTGFAGLCQGPLGSHQARFTGGHCAHLARIGDNRIIDPQLVGLLRQLGHNDGVGELA